VLEDMLSTPSAQTYSDRLKVVKEGKLCLTVRK
jgi:hypothetical protein